jgi:hypothetical protein
LSTELYNASPQLTKTGIEHRKIEIRLTNENGTSLFGEDNTIDV